MTDKTTAKAPGGKKRGRVVIGAISLVLVGLIGGFIAIGKIVEPAKNCVFISDEAPASNNQQQTVVVLSPTQSFVDIDSVTTRAKTGITESLGAALPDEDIDEALNRELSVIIGDGDPKLVVHTAVVGGGLAANTRRTINETMYGTLEKVVSCAVGSDKKPADQVETTNEANFLKALTVASSQLTTNGKKVIYVLGNGIQTAGQIQMQDKGLFPSSEKTAETLAKALFISGEIPDLSDVEVHWFGLGQVDGEYQKPLSLSYQKGLVAFWKKVISLGGGNLVETCTECGSGKPSEASIPVATVKPKSCNLIVELYESDGVEFVHDSTDFVSPQKAQSAAERTVSKFNAKKCESMTVTGYAAAGKNRSQYEANQDEIDETNKTLTKNRAAAFSVLLREAGFKGEITFVGGGTCMTEWDSNGKSVQELQRKCRKVEVSN